MKSSFMFRQCNGSLEPSHDLHLTALYKVSSVLTMAVIFGFAKQDIQLTVTWWLMVMCLYALLRNIKIPIGKSKIFDEYTLSLLHALMMVSLGYDIVLYNDNDSFFGTNTEQEVL